MNTLAIFGVSQSIYQKESSACDEFQTMNCIEYTNVQGKYADSSYVFQHKIYRTRFTYKATGEKEGYPLSNAFDHTDKDSYWAAATPNSDTYHNSIVVEFKKAVSIEAILYYPSFFSRGSNRIFNGSPTKLKIYTSIDNKTYQLEGIFVGTPQKDWNQFQFVLSQPVLCDKIKLEFVEVTADTHTSGGAFTPVTGGITFIQSFTDIESGSTNLAGNFANKEYFNSHKISTDKFTYESTPSKSDKPLKNAFDTSDKGTYWVTQYPNNDTFHNSITVTFSNLYYIEGLVYYPAYNTPQGKPRNFHGVPTKMNVYTSSGDKKLELAHVLYCSPENGWNEIQYVFPKPLRCDKLMLEFIEVTPENFFSGGALNVAVGGIAIMQSIQYSTINYTQRAGKYDNKTYLTMHRWSPSRFTYTASGQKDDAPISNAFDYSDSGTYWVAAEPNTETFHNTINVSFKEPLLLEAILYYASFNSKGGDRVFNGVPLKLIIWTSINNEKYEQKAVFVGSPQKDWNQFQFVFPSPVHCDKVVFEFVEVSPNSLNSGGALTPTTGGITFYGIIEGPNLQYCPVAGNFADKTYVSQHKLVPTTDFTYESTPVKEGYPISNAFDGSIDKSYWVALNTNTDTYHNNITVTFNSLQGVEAFLLYPTFTNSASVYHGTPLEMNVWAAIENDKYELKATFRSAPEKGWKQLQFVFISPVVCKQMRLEIVEVTPDNWAFKDGKQHPSLGDLVFLKTEIPAATQVPQATQAPPLPTPARTAFPPVYSCGDSNNRCDIKGEEDKPAHVSISLTDFNKVTFNEDGGAIHLIDSTLDCENVKFNGCQSNSGGGGGIFVDNKNVVKAGEIRLESLQFTGCKALYGGGVYVCSSSESVPVKVSNCEFTKNEATAAKSGSTVFWGGSALFVNAKAGSLTNNIFSENKGSGAVKIINEFDKDNSKLLLHNDLPSFLLSDSRFVNTLDSSCLLFYVAGNNGVNCEVKNCIFSGALQKGSHYIDGVSLSKESKKLHVSKCKFAADSHSSLNMNSDNDFLSVNLKNQVFNFDQIIKNDNNGKKASLLTFSNLVFAGSALVVVSVLVILLRHKKQSQLNDISEEDSENNDQLIEKSLI